MKFSSLHVNHTCICFTQVPIFRKKNFCGI